MNFAANWNRLDSFIYLCESKIKDIITEQKEDEPDVELFGFLFLIINFVYLVFLIVKRM